jgi:cellulose synthase/poly-beta-1,6-N-acetylglucosamine synthase-like glycosyltransferase
MFIVIIISFFVIFSYCLLIFIFINGWMKTEAFKPTVTQEFETKCSIIIAARNEAGQIENILSDIIQQEYPRELFEIIIVNDHSEDNTANIVSFFQQGNAISLINLQGEKTGKKAALTEGITLSNGELILTLDADCRVGKRWLMTIVQFYKEYNSTVIMSPVDFHKKKGFWNKIQNLEFLSLVGSSACAINNGQAFLCNGANLAYKRKVFLQLEDPFSQNISSGDDVFFLHKVKKINDSQIHFLKNSDAIAYTHGVNSIKSFLSQRVRWASKSSKINDSESLVFMAIISAMNLLLLFLFGVSIINSNYVFIFIACLGIKTIVDFAFFKQILPFFEKENLLKQIPLTNFFYFLYFAIMIILSLVMKPKWKGRSIKV